MLFCKPKNITNRPRLVVTNDEEEDDWDVPDDFVLDEVPELEWHESDDLVTEKTDGEETKRMATTTRIADSIS